MTALLAIGVVPSCWNSAPLTMPLILKCVTEPASAGLGVITRPDAVATSANVVALVTAGVSAIGLTTRSKVSIAVKRIALMVFDTVTLIVVVPNWFGCGVIARLRLEP